MLITTTTPRAVVICRIVVIAAHVLTVELDAFDAARSVLVQLGRIGQLASSDLGLWHDGSIQTPGGHSS